MTPDSLFFLWNNALVCPPPNCYCPIANENMFCILKSIVQQNIQYCCQQRLFKIDCSCILKALFLNMQTLGGLALLTLQNSKLCVIRRLCFISVKSAGKLDWIWQATFVYCITLQYVVDWITACCQRYGLYCPVMLWTAFADTACT